MNVLFGQPKQRADIRDERINDRVDTIIGAGTVFTGDLEIKGTLRIDGKCEGKITSSGDVVVGEGGLVVSAVEARNLQVAGTVRGGIKTSGILEISATGKVYGDIEVGKVVIADGAIFQGQCRMHTAEAQTTAPAKKE
ncbi:MAG: polymer-forming cytoskeletal protein [Selenomonadales bacterium]|nr:polymer-forming cytoskeletal protein [Selenomonadales bacterium]